VDAHYQRPYNIEMEYKKIGREGLDYVQLAQDRIHLRDLVNTLMQLRVSRNQE
jgi:hypothetical protein